jgi:hypothetical protein
MSLAIGDRAPAFSLPATDGPRSRSATGTQAAATVVVFTCNHCPTRWPGTSGSSTPPPTTPPAAS